MEIFMKVGIIDMGTNTFHLVIVEVANGHFDFVYRDKRAVRLGKGGINEGYITEDARNRALAALEAFKQVLDHHGVSEIHVTATSAVRNAKNGPDLVADIRKKTGLEVTVISGIEEAEYIYFGVTEALEIGREPALIMDIGGGSIEFIIGNSREAWWKQSFEIGGQRLMELFHENDPITPREIENIERYLAEQLDSLFASCAEFKPKTLIGSSGTFDTLSDIHTHNGGKSRDVHSTEYPLTLDGFSHIHQQLLTKSRKERLAMPGMIELRVDMIVVASILIQFLVRKLNIEKIRVSAYALKEGVMLHHLKTKGEISS